MRVAKGNTSGSASAKGGDNFTGEVFIDSVFPAAEGVMISSVFFAPGSRTHWHSHENGQVLMVARGRGLVVNREGDSVEITAGDVVHAGPGEVHWHGGSRESFMIHTAVSLGNTSWFGEVSNDDYLKESK